jgi:glycosyltransferase involved in cell wall biosynthesis
MEHERGIERDQGPLISIIVPAYKVPRENLYACLDGLAGQTLKDIEIVAVDDGCPKGSGKILDEYGAKDPRFVVIHQENQGVSRARNNALARARGEYVLFVDADDQLHREACAELYPFARDNHLDVVLFGARLQRPAGERVELAFSADIPLLSGEQKLSIIRKTLLGQSYEDRLIPRPVGMTISGTWCKLIRRKFLSRTGVHFRPGVTIAQDALFYLDVYEQAERIGYLARPLYYYALVDSSSVHRFRPGVISDWKKFDGFVADYARRHRREGWRGLFDMQYVLHLYSALLADVMHPDNPASSHQARAAQLRVLCEDDRARKALRGADTRGFPARHKLLILLMRLRMYRSLVFLLDKFIRRKAESGA